MSDITPAQRAALIEAHASLPYGGLVESGKAWVPDHPDLCTEYRSAEVLDLHRRGLFQVAGDAPQRFGHITETGIMEIDMFTHDQRLAATVEQLERMPLEARLAALKDLVLKNGGRWDLPHIHGAHSYRPFLSSIQLFGAYAATEDPEDLPRVWLRAARNSLKGAAALEEDAA